MTDRELLLSCFSNCIDKTAKEFCALVTNEKGSGAIEKQCTDAKKFADEYTQTYNVYEQTGEMLDKTVSFFSFLERFKDEGDKALQARLKAIFYRNGDTLWGTPRNIIEVFRSYFPSGKIYIAENTNENTDSNNLIDDGDFVDKTVWTLSGDADYKVEARFSKAYGVSLGENGSLKQSVNVQVNKTYFVHWFMTGNCNVNIKDNLNRYWNNDTLQWQDSKKDIPFTSEEWDAKNIYFITDENISSITIQFTSNNNESETYIDYVRLFLKQPYGSFTIIVQFEGSSADNALALAPGKADTEIKPYYGYYNIDALTGAASGFAKDIYNDLLDFVRPSGVKAYIEIINKDYFED